MSSSFIKDSSNVHAQTQHVIDLCKLLLGLASTVILVSESHETRDPGDSRGSPELGLHIWAILRRRIGALLSCLRTPRASSRHGHYSDMYCYTVRQKALQPSQGPLRASVSLV
jgi:hypothetical protein